jgi:hypothetical protein
MNDQDRKLSKAIGRLADVLGTKTSALVAMAVLKEYGPLLKQLGLFDAKNVVLTRQADEQ